MKTLLLILLASSAAFSQIPLSGEKKQPKIGNDELKNDFLLPQNQFQPIPKPLKSKKEVGTMGTYDYNAVRKIPQDISPEYYDMPIKKVSPDNYSMPIKNVGSFDEMNADFYFEHKRTTIPDKKD